MSKIHTTPGVYMEEKSAFPNSAVPVATAVPAFIGYTEKAVLNKKDITNVPTRISSFGEYRLYFGDGPKTTYSLEKDEDPNKIYKLSPKDKWFFLYRCIKMFFANGGSDCYIVSVGNYDSKIKLDDFDNELIEEASGEKKLFGIKTLLKEPEPTMLVIPDAVLLEDPKECADLQQRMLNHCGVDMRNRIAILDIYNGDQKRTPDATKDVVTLFRESVGNHLQWGAVYYPWVHTTITGADALDFTNIDSGSNATLKEILTAEVEDAKKAGTLDAKRAEAILEEIAKIDLFNPQAMSVEDALKTAATDKIATQHQTLLAVSPLYKAVMGSLREHINLLPPAAGMAGVYSMIDNTIGVFHAPANVSFGSVIRPAVDLTNDEQEDLNTPLNGKAVNAIRSFPGKGVLVWGARTLDGNSQDWKYVSVRRTVIFIEQSIKYAAAPYVFSPNTAATWANVKAMLINFLTNVWQQGALAGATPEDAFSVDIGLGVTMTPADLLDGIMRITVKLAVTRPAEFIVITFEQQMQKS
jgi:uncharacterized protein